MASKRPESPMINKRIAFKAEVLQAIETLARERGLSLQAALKASFRTLPANDQPQTRKRR
ncbi:hypothetical protein ACO2I3_19005 [Leptospira interrogans]